MDGNKSHFVHRAGAGISTRDKLPHPLITARNRPIPRATQPVRRLYQLTLGRFQSHFISARGGAWTQAAGLIMRTQLEYRSITSNTMYIGPHGHVVIVTQIVRGNLWSMDGGRMLLLRHISGRNYRNGYSKISSVNTGEQPVGTAFVIETGNSKHPWLVHALTMRAFSLIIDGN